MPDKHAEMLGVELTENQIRGICAMLSGDEWKLIGGMLGQMLNDKIEAEMGRSEKSDSETIGRIKEDFWFITILSSLPNTAAVSLREIIEPAE